MEEVKEEKSKEDLLKDLQVIASKMNTIKSTVEVMLDEFEELENKYFKISEQIRKN